jgi:hypothetical protein
MSKEIVSTSALMFRTAQNNIKYKVDTAEPFLLSLKEEQPQ